MSSTEPDGLRRVLVLIKGLGIGGAERLISGGSAHWDRDEFEYRVAYILPWKDQLVDELVSAGILVDCIGGSRGLDPKTPLRLRTLVKDWKPDLIHAHSPVTGILARVTTKVPIVYTEHNLAHSYRQPTRTLNKMTYRRNAAVTTVSDAVAASLTAYRGPTPVVVPNGVSPRGIGADSLVRQELGIQDSVPLVVHVGNVRPHKGHTNLIAATARLADLVPQSIVVSIGAEKTPGDLDRLRQLASDSGVGDRIRFLGRRPDATAFLGAADVVVNPSDLEGLPVTILEALAMARPVVATDVGGVSSVVLHEKTGLLVPPKDPEALSAAIARAIESSHAQEWGRAGAERVARDHSIEKMVRNFEAIYKRVLT